MTFRILALPKSEFEGLFALSGSVAPCDGITVQSVEFTSRSGQVSHYLVLKGSRQPASGIRSPGSARYLDSSWLRSLSGVQSA